MPQMENLVKETLEYFQKGDIVIYPTDTVWGVGCVISNEGALRRLYEIKQRENKPFTILVSSLKMAQKYGEFNDLALKLARNFWPGGLTIIVPSRPELSNYPAHQLITQTTEEEATVALRVPNHPFLIEVIDSLGEGLSGPSANFAGQTPPLSKDQIDIQFKKLVDHIVDSDQSGHGLSSTIVDTTEARPQILREGAVSTGEILKVANQT